MQQVFPKWVLRRHRRIWESKWVDPRFDPFWKTNQPQRELVEAIESDWFPRNQRVIDLGCGNGEVSRWLASQGFAVLGFDYSVAAIDNCRYLSAGQPNAPTFEVADLCREDLQLEPAASLIDRGCFHRIVENLRPIFAQNIARATVEGGHFLLLAATFQDPRAAHYTGVRSARRLRKHVEEIFGKYFTIEKTEPAVINATKGQKAMPAVAFWMVRQPTPLSKIEAGTVAVSWTIANLLDAA
jgi:2-heptyl-1-hydroxyquinolin-4(1H)-one methyltransferase